MRQNRRMFLGSLGAGIAVLSLPEISPVLRFLNPYTGQNKDFNDMIHRLLFGEGAAPTGDCGRARGILQGLQRPEPLAIELDPDYATAHAWLAYWGILAVSHGWVENPRPPTSQL